MISEKIIQSLEEVEIQAWADLYRSASEEVVREGGIGVQRVGSGHLFIASKIDMLAMNRVLGFGTGGEGSLDQLEAIVQKYRDAGSPRFFFQVSPLGVPQNLPRQLEHVGLKPYNRWVKLYRGVDEPLAGGTDLYIKEIGPEESEPFGQVLGASFEWPEIMGRWFACTLGRSGWRHYMAYETDRPAAIGAMFVRGAYAWFDMAGTLAEYRGRGAQGALLQIRIRDAAAMGCRWIVAETAEETPDRSAPSYRNTLRSGFRVAYLRQNYMGAF
jgi:GNAT superfamily N-acetyltransferase